MNKLVVLVLCLSTFIIGSVVANEQEDVIPKMIVISSSRMPNKRTANGILVLESLYFRILMALFEEFRDIPDGADYRSKEPIFGGEYHAITRSPNKRFSWNHAASTKPKLCILLEELVERLILSVESPK
ncbi:hypothetical protein DFA_05545 [Cavenderia fasciculata]|uniref:Uncharacterized protein n=1 Tax=Cavenderia fasciculata TaxID=261658 RepID=F4PLJ1_CACFS|nr:uncharacterized protein DFA_05545 [Cavenderia fasciculata]EGG23413.1 hypothetical protein DFA_05545 [Cavenderia fasciculata]|eukprot:XP_004361264.1 hypothetical protein DFA_05545 [Cavenderia fasciculata]